MIPPLYLQVIVVIGIVIILAIFFHYVPFFLWLSAKVSGVRVSLVQLFLMRITSSCHCTRYDRSPQSRTEHHYSR